MSPLLCNDGKAILAVQKYISKIKNENKRYFAEAFWYAILDESAGKNATYPLCETYRLKYTVAQTIRNRITDVIKENRTVWQ